jgi:two-component system, OmpR family, sensor kinase
VIVSLRARLLVGMVVLVATGLAVAAVVTYEEQRSFLLNRVDQQVESGVGPISFQLRLSGAAGRGAGGSAARSDRFGAGLAARRRPPGIGDAAVLPPGTFGEVLGPSGQVLRRRTFSYGEKETATPKLPAHPPLSRTVQKPRFFTVGSTTDSGLRYRAMAFADAGDTAIVAVPLREVDQTLHRLIVVEALVGGGVIIALILLGWVVIRIGLRPLERIGRVASEIAGGDLSRRVSPAESRTEVGRLGLSLNEMLGQIERAFGDRRQSEDRLRRFLADASHELRTPLAAIRGYAELFRIGAADDRETLERAMTRIEAESARMGVLVEDLLLLAQLDQAPEPRRVPVDLLELVSHTIQDTHVIAPEHRITLQDGEPTAVLGDPDQLRQLVTNLTRNAVIHTPPGTSIELALDHDGDQARLSVRDHGPGLPPGASEQLFERFWRTEGGRRRGRAGAGLGLAIVRAIVTAHHGTVSAANDPGGGARFVVMLPLAPVAAPAASQESLSLLTVDSYPDRAH